MPSSRRVASRGRSKSGRGGSSSRWATARRPWAAARRSFVPRGPFIKASPFPDSITVALPYVSALTLATPAAFSMTNQVWRMNSVYDPDYSGAGHQPQGFDEYALLYASYRVNYVDVEIEAFTGAGEASTVMYGIMPQQGAILPTSPEAFAENENTVCGLLRPYSGGTAGTMDTNVVFKKRIYPHRLMGLSGSSTSLTRNSSSAVTGNPAYTPQLIFGIAATDSTVSSVETLTKLRINVTFF